MPDPATFQQAFGLALARRGPRIADPRMARALAIHRNTAARAAAEALADNHPVVRALVGNEAFEAAAAAFVERHPPSEPRLCLYGDGFAAHVAGHAPFADLAYLPDVASLERLVVEALFAADQPPLDAAAVASGVDLEAPLALHAATRFASFASPTGSIWLAHAPGARDDALERIEFRGEAVLVTRPDDAVAVTVLPPGAIEFLEATRSGATLGEAALLAGDGLEAAFSTLISAGAFASPTRKEDRP